uniref:Uncharacterized protein n=1 Tax=Sus scrofa TaxID=9823 RepID=A0A8D0V4C4_PIG
MRRALGKLLCAASDSARLRGCGWGLGAVLGAHLSGAGSGEGPGWDGGWARRARRRATVLEEVMGYFGLCVFRVCVRALRVHNRERGGHSYRQAGLPRVVGVSFPGGKACRVMMLPLSTIEGKDTPTEEVKTKPPEKGALPSEKPEKAPRKPTRMKGTVSFKLLPICPMVSLPVSSL